MEPITTATVAAFLFTSTVGGFSGNRSDTVLCNVCRNVYNRWRNHSEPVNHDIQRAVRGAYLKATLVVCQRLIAGKSNVLKRFLIYPTLDIKRVVTYLRDQLHQLSDDALNVPDSSAVVQYDLLIQPRGTTATQRTDELKQRLRTAILDELTTTCLHVEDDLKRAILYGLPESGKTVDWYDLVCAFFTEELKSNERLSRIIDVDLQLELREQLAGSQWPDKVLEKQVEQIGKAMQPLVEQYDQLLMVLDEMLDLLGLLRTDIAQVLQAVETGNDVNREMLLQILAEIAKLQKQFPDRHKYLNRFPHYDMANLVGRTTELNRIQQHFQDHRLLILQGMGGICKSTLSRAYISRNAEHYQHIAFVEVVGTIAQSLLDTLGTSSDVPFTYDTNQTADENFMVLLDALRHRPYLLLVLDNANNPADLLARRDALESLNAKVLITSRSKPDKYVMAQQVEPIGALPPHDALQLFTRLCGRPLQPDENTLVNNILQKAFYHPKLIEVIVTQIQRNDFLTLSGVNTIVEKKRYKDDEINYPDEADEQAKTIYSILLDLFNTDTLTEEQKQLLRYFAVLPAVDIPIQHLSDLLDMTSPAERQSLNTQLKKLALTAWLDTPSSGYYSVHGLIQ